MNKKKQKTFPLLVPVSFTSYNLICKVQTKIHLHKLHDKSHELYVKMSFCIFYLPISIQFDCNVLLCLLKPNLTYIKSGEDKTAGSIIFPCRVITGSVSAGHFDSQHLESPFEDFFLHLFSL